MRVLGVLIPFLGLLLSGCASDDPQIRMGVHTHDARKTECSKDCDSARKACAHEKRLDQSEDREEVSGPSEVSKSDWEKVYKQAKELAERCEKERRSCLSRCP